MDGAEKDAAPAVELVARLRNLNAIAWTFAHLFRLGDQAVGALDTFLRGPAESIPQPRCLAAEILAAIGTPAATVALRRAFEICAARTDDLDPLLADAERTVANEIATHLGDLRDAGAADLLLAALQRHAWSGCARALGRLQDRRAIAILADRLGDDNARSAATEALRLFGSDAAVALSRALLRQPTNNRREPASHVSGRATAAMLLGEVGGDLASLPLIWSLFDDEPSVRLATAVALARLGTDAGQVALPHLIERLGAEHWLEADDAADAIVALGETVVPAVSQVAADGRASTTTRRRAAEILGRLGPEAPRPALASEPRGGAGPTDVSEPSAAHRGQMTEWTPRELVELDDRKVSDGATG